MSVNAILEGQSYTRVEEDALLQQINNTIAAVGGLGQGVEIPAYADLDTYLTPGTFYSYDSDRSATISNTPIKQSGFVLIVMNHGFPSDESGTENTVLQMVLYSVNGGSHISLRRKWYNDTDSNNKHYEWYDWTEVNKLMSTTKTAWQNGVLISKSFSITVTASTTSVTTGSDALITSGGVYNYAPPRAHASTANTYGKGSTIAYGHVKLSDSTTSTASASDGIAATPKAVHNIKPSMGTILFQDNWSGSGPYYQGVNVSGPTVTNNSMISLLPTAEEYARFLDAGVTGLLISNNNTQLTATCFGATFSATIIHCIVTEVNTA